MEKESNFDDIFESLTSDEDMRDLSEMSADDAEVILGNTQTFIAMMREDMSRGMSALDLFEEWIEGLDDVRDGATAFMMLAVTAMSLNACIGNQLKSVLVTSMGSGCVGDFWDDSKYE